MNVRFVSADPRERARPELDTMLAHGTDQLAIACAFLTPGGVETLNRHAALFIDEHLEEEDKFAFIYRAKYRV